MRKRVFPHDGQIYDGRPCSSTRGSMARCRRVPHWRRTQYGTAARARGRGPAPLRDPRPLAHVSPHNEAAARLSPSCARASDPRMRATSTTSPIRASGPYGGSAGGAHGPHRPQPTPRWTRHGPCHIQTYARISSHHTISPTHLPRPAGTPPLGQLHRHGAKTIVTSPQPDTAQPQPTGCRGTRQITSDNAAP